MEKEKCPKTLNHEKIKKQMCIVYITNTNKNFNCFYKQKL